MPTAENDHTLHQLEREDRRRSHCQLAPPRHKRCYSDVIDHVLTGDFHGQILRPRANIQHLKSAPGDTGRKTLTTSFSQARSTFLRQYAPKYKITANTQG